MKIAGRVWKSKKDTLWIVEVPFLDFMTQATTKEEIPEMVKDAIELLIDDPSFSVNVTVIDNTVLIKSNNQKKLMALILKRQRIRCRLKLEDVAVQLKAKSINDYAQYEQGKHMPSFEKFEKLLKAIDPNLSTFISCR